MKGLLLKDWYLITRYCRFVYLVDLVFIVGALFLPGNAFILVYPYLFAATVPLTLYSYDEREKWHIYSAVLPVSRAQFVSAKYIAGLLSEAAVLLLTIALRVAVRPVLPGGAQDDLILILIGSVLGLVMPAVVLPLMFRLGAEKGRIGYTIVIAVVCSASVVFLNRDTASVSRSVTLHPAVLCAAVLVIYAASWLLSVAIYKKREL